MRHGAGGDGGLQLGDGGEGFVQTVEGFEGAGAAEAGDIGEGRIVEALAGGLIGGEGAFVVPGGEEGAGLVEARELGGLASGVDNGAELFGLGGESKVLHGDILLGFALAHAVEDGDGGEEPGGDDGEGLGSLILPPVQDGEELLGHAGDVLEVGEVLLGHSAPLGGWG